jgi:hypothetical protein
MDQENIVNAASMSLEAMFPEHWERGTERGTRNTIL